MRSALVTGATGFIGSNLVARLVRSGCAVRAVLSVRSAVPEWPKHVDVMRADVRDADAMKAASVGIDTVFHLAAKTHALSEVEGDEGDYRSLNVEGTRSVLEGAVAGGVRRFVFFSSVKVFGEESSECRNESTAAAPLTAYGRSKLAAEALVFDYADRYRFGATCLRLPLVYGRGNKGNLFRMIAAIDRGTFPSFPPIQNRRSMVHVSNVVAAAMLAADHPAACGRCYIVTDARAYSTRELYESIRRALGKPVPRWSVPLGVLTVMGYIGDCLGRSRGRRVGFDTESLAKLTGSAVYSAGEISRELGYRPTVSFEEALPEMIEWYRQTRK